ncbi:unnamed protein product [Linum tenue]|uniref:Uncharacterized protein n=1 Tax=Linum tenue TaxID=586396 RepID=A0AAV0R2U9_9ROSI|nr:unnamed protein product [Linum tenue]
MVFRRQNLTTPRIRREF